MFKNKKNKENNVPRLCCFCENASIINDESNVLCSRKGIVNREYCCRRFQYDPLKRVPKAPPAMPKLSEIDLVL
ncbi:MAG: hypothetical protein PUE85_06700 [Firmicutes bacterium]|nr:hypothetical protein [Bacillota bacterium]